jgi:transposase
MELTAIYKRVIGLDVHQAKISACAVAEQADGKVTVESREFGGFKRDRRALAQWAKSFGPEVVVMESTGIYWKSPYAALESVGIAAWVVNARHVKTVPGRKTDVADAQWLATLARAGLLRASFIPPADIRHLRLIARQRQKLGGMLSSEKNRLHKLLADAGIRLNVVVSDIHGQAARAMVKALIEGQTIAQILDLAGRLRASRADLFEALQPEELSGAHLFVLSEIMAHIEELEARMGRFEQALLAGLSAWQPQLVLLQTIPGIDVMGAAMLLVEISADMHSFGSAERLASWVGICPGNNESAGKRKSGKTRKGNA